MFAAIVIEMSQLLPCRSSICITVKAESLKHLHLQSLLVCPPLIPAASRAMRGLLQ